MIHFRVRYERLRDRLGWVRRRAALVRAAWLALAVPLAGVVLSILRGAALAPGLWLVGAGLVFVLAAWWGGRPAPEGALDRDLDRRFGLDELLVTAVEVDRRGPRGAIEARLLDDAASAVAEIGGERAIDGRATRREVETFAALGLILAGLWLLAGTLGGPPPQARLPEIAAGGGGGDGAGSGPGSGDGLGGGGGSPAMGRLAAELGDHAAARGIAAALGKGDPAAAARAARALADRAEALSPAGRAELSRTLDSLAEDLGPQDPTLAEALREAGRALRDPAAPSPNGGIERLAEALDALAGSSAARPAPTVAPRGRPGLPAERLAVQPTPAAAGLKPERSRGGRTTGMSARPGAETGGARTEARPVPVRGGAVTARPAVVGADPLRYPWEMRDMVRQYFDPREGPNEPASP